MPAIKGCIYIYIYILTHFLTSQPALIKLDNENIGGYLIPLHRSIAITGIIGTRAVSAIAQLVFSLLPSY